MDSINLKGIAQVDADKFVEEFINVSSVELSSLVDKINNPEDKAILQDISMKIVAAYQRMYLVPTVAERRSIQRSINNYKSSIASISARYSMDVANTIISICQKSAVLALGVAVKFVAI